MSQNKNQNPFYITTTLPYVNAEPHLGHAMEFVRADTVARWKRLCGYDVFFNTGTDEHGQKLFEAAVKDGLPVEEYVDKNVVHFKDLLKFLNISNDGFVRTTEERHIEAAREMWRLCDSRGYIYKKNYEAKYCVGCELEKQDSDLNQDGKCPDHPNRDLEVRNEENYFFAFSKLQNELEKFYEDNPNFVVPDFRFNEIKNFVKGGLQDFSISRLKSKMSWGVPVPNDDEHVMYVWFDALTSYISSLGFGTPSVSLRDPASQKVSTGEAITSDAREQDPSLGKVPKAEGTDNFEKFWLQNGNTKREVIQYCGKDNLRQQSAIWQGMLLAAGIKNSTNIIINGFMTAEGGVKMSKSLGNVVSPVDLVSEFGTDALRHYVLKEISSFEDSPFSTLKFKESYNANLANGIGNQTSRILKLTSQHLTEDEVKEILEIGEKENLEEKYKEYFESLNNFDLNKAINFVFGLSRNLDEYIQETSPFKLLKAKEELIEKENEENKIKGKEILKKCLADLLSISHHLYIFLPETSMNIYNCIKENKTPVDLFGKSLFERK